MSRFEYLSSTEELLELDKSELARAYLNIFFDRNLIKQERDQLKKTLDTIMETLNIVHDWGKK